MWSALILISWVCALLVSVSTSPAHAPSGSQNKSNVAEEYQAAAQQRPSVHQQATPAQTAQQTDRNEQRYRQEMLRIATEQTKAMQRQATASERQASATEQQVRIYWWLLVAAIAEGVLLTLTVAFTGMTAIAGKRSADALSESDRPYLTIRPQNVRIWGDPANRQVSIELHNAGRLPARLSWYGIRAKAHDGIDLPGPPEYPDPPRRHFFVIAPNDALRFMAAGDFGLTGTGNTVFFYGFIDYQSLDRRVSYRPLQFCFYEARSFAVLAGDDSYWEGKKPYKPRKSDERKPSGATLTPVTPFPRRDEW